MKNLSIKEKFLLIWNDERGYFKRLGIAIFPCFLITFTCLLFGSVDVFFVNYGSLEFIFTDFIFIVIGITIAATLILVLVLALLRGKAFDTVLAVFLGIGICFWLQGTFLNPQMGSLDGSQIDWSAYTGYAVLNCLIWVAVIAGIVLIMHKAKGVYAKLYYFLPVLIIGMQLFAGVFSFINASERAFEYPKESEYELVVTEQLNVSQNENIIVFILDYFSNTYIDPILEQYPDSMDFLKDFTFYTNADTTYFGTLPSLTHLLTGNKFDPSIGTREWYESSWQSERANVFYNSLRAHNYGAYVYAEAYLFGGADLAAGKLSNAKETRISAYTVNHSAMLKQLLGISMFRYMPLPMKPLFWMGTASNIVSKEYEQSSEEAVTWTSGQNYIFYEKLITDGIKAVPGENRYIVHHLFGTHPEYTINERCEYEENTSLAQCGKGCFVLVEEYLKQMKELGVYDNSTIIITSDHGDWVETQPIYFIKPSGVKKQSMTENAAPISHEDFFATILACADIEEDMGRSIFDIEETEERERTILIRKNDEAYPKVHAYKSTTKFATENVYYAYTYVGDRDDLAAVIQTGPTEIIPMKESLYQ